MAMQSRLARPIFTLARRNAVLPASKSAFARPDIVDISTYEYPNNALAYAGKGPRGIPEAWNRDEKTVHYLIPKSFVDWITPKLGETGIYTLGGFGLIALLSKELFVMHGETRVMFSFFFTWCVLNMLGGDSVREMAAEQFTSAYDRLYAVKEHDIEAYAEIVEQYKEAQMQAQGQALYNQQKLTNLALMLETEYLSRQNNLVSEITRKLNYQVAIEAALADHESRHMINWIESEVQAELSKLDQDEQIQACVDHLKTL